jgi:tripartite-type tricarboxylate transporter receptor subunit TctC
MPFVAQAAQMNFPDKPIRLVIGSAPGSGPDLVARVLSERLWRAWGQRVVVDARPGAAGTISADHVMRSAADGYTWMMLTSQLFVASEVYPNLKFSLEKHFGSVGLLGTVPFVLMVNQQLPVKSVRELVDYARKSPGSLRYGSSGAGATEHLSALMLTNMTNTKMLHVPYKGIAQAIGDTTAGEVHLTFAVLPAALGAVQSNRVRAFGVSSRKRAQLLPDVPPIADTVPGYESFGWYSLVVPMGTPNAVLEKVSAEVSKACKEPEFGEQLKTLGLDLVCGTRAEMDQFRREETKRLRELVKSAGLDLK